MTVVVLLSAGRIIMSLFLVRSVRACHSSGVALYLGGFAEFNMLATVALARSALWGSLHFCRAASTPAMISARGTFAGQSLKFNPFSRAFRSTIC